MRIINPLVVTIATATARGKPRLAAPDVERNTRDDSGATMRRIRILGFVCVMLVPSAVLGQNRSP
jgi:hypothetical protein